MLTLGSHVVPAIPGTDARVTHPRWQGFRRFQTSGEGGGNLEKEHVWQLTPYHKDANPGCCDPLDVPGLWGREIVILRFAEEKK